MTTTLTRTQSADLGELRAMLEQQRAFRLDQLDELRHAEEKRFVSDVDREIIDSLTKGAFAALHDILDALERMDRGRYGSCLACSTPLEIERLEVLPQAALCMPCQRAAEAA
jgi:DnaK suppressor protein